MEVHPEEVDRIVAALRTAPVTGQRAVRDGGRHGHHAHQQQLRLDRRDDAGGGLRPARRRLRHGRRSPRSGQQWRAHQLLVVGHEDGTYQVYEPNTGVWEVNAEDMAAGVLPPEVVESLFGNDRYFAHDGYYLP